MQSNYIHEDKTDEDLVKLSLIDSNNFVLLMNRYENKFLRYIRRISNSNHEDAEDILQDSFIKMYQNLNAFDPKLKFSSWAYRITHNQVISEYRKKKSRPLFYFSEIVDEMLTSLKEGNSLEDKIDADLQNKKILKIINELDKKYREVMHLKFIENKTYEEISDILQKPIGTVGTLINRAKKKFKKEYERDK
ncbi:sigma-70 family RNA polymerase sigma factor [Patescibacteria group bacterium]|nr:sigma-70 family RNA polymerase sigma factor [Patescibacteria group bacterium]